MLRTASTTTPPGGPSGSAFHPPQRRPDASHAAEARGVRQPTGGDPRWVVIAGVGRQIRVKIASEREELEQAFRLLADRYKARGYESSDAGEFRFTPYHALRGTVTLVAKDGDRVVATLSLVPD